MEAGAAACLDTCWWQGCGSERLGLSRPVSLLAGKPLLLHCRVVAPPSPARLPPARIVWIVKSAMFNGASEVAVL